MNKPLRCAAMAIALSVLSVPPDAKRCIKGAIIGGLAGHLAGHHGTLGAAAGCAIGHHEAAKQKSVQPSTTGNAPPRTSR
jgi:hypothetical protein